LLFLRISVEWNVGSCFACAGSGLQGTVATNEGFSCELCLEGEARDLMYEKTDDDLSFDQSELLVKILSQNADMAGAQLTATVP
jgi:hypothetical protein